MPDDPITRGNTLVTDITVRDDAGALVDPTALTLSVRTPSGTSTTFTYPSDAEVIRDSVGVFHAEVVLSEIGVWEYEWSTTSPSRVSGDQVYVVSDPTSSSPAVNSVADHTRFWLGGENWNILTSSEHFGVAYVLIGVENVKRRVLTSPPPPSGESSLNGNVLAYLGILSALELIPATRDAWASKVISRSTGNDPAEITTYTDRSKRIDDLQKDLLSRVDGLRKAALPYLEDVPGYTTSSPDIDEDDDLKVTDDPRCFPPTWSFPYQRDEVVVRGRPS